MPKYVTPEQLRRIVELRDRRWTVQAIAEDIGRTVATVNYHLLKMGHEVSKPMPLPTRRRAVPVQRKGRTVRPFTAAEDRQLLEMAGRQTSYSDMGRSLNRKPHCCSDRLRRLYRHIDRGTAIGVELNQGDSP